MHPPFQKVQLTSEKWMNEEINKDQRQRGNLSVTREDIFSPKYWQSDSCLFNTFSNSSKNNYFLIQVDSKCSN